MFKILGKIFRFIIGDKKTVSRRNGVLFNRAMVVDKWAEIEQLVELGGASRFKTAIMEADKLLDYTLKGKGYKGETMGDRLKWAQRSMRRDTLDAAWNAHKYRNRVVHDVETDVMHYEVKKQIENFRKVFKELGVL